MRTGYFPDGVTRILSPIKLTHKDSGKADAPTVIRGSRSGNSQISGAAVVRGTKIQDVNASRAPTQPTIYALDLSSLPQPRPFGIERRGAYFDIDQSRFELFQNGLRLHLARWPKLGYSTAIRAALDSDDQSGTSVMIPRDAFARLNSEKDIWLGGYWTQDWAFETAPIERFGEDGETVQLPRIKAPGKLRSGFKYFVQNARSELSEPGEYILNSNREAFVIPTNESDQFEVAIATTLLEISNAHDIVIEDVAFEKTLGTTIKIVDSENITIRNCFVGRSGAGAIRVTGGRNVVIDRCVIRDTAETAVLLSGGDRPTLTPAGHAITNSIVTDFGIDSRTYRPAVQVTGVGIRVEGCFLSRGPHSAIILAGNDNLIRGNEISAVVQETDDAGAIYTGRDWTHRGNEIDGNFFHDIGMRMSAHARSPSEPSFVSAIYLDDQESGYRISRNIFWRVGRPIVIHGGRDNLIEENVFVANTHGAIWLHKRGEALGGELERRLRAVPYDRDRWATRYPALATLAENDPGSPVNNKEKDNILLGHGTLVEFRAPEDAQYWAQRDTTTAIGRSRRGWPVTSPEDLQRYLSAQFPGTHSIPVRSKALSDLQFSAH
ncbi:right-handed parallel beta-helix repeat-containing protein [Bradyrhizobium sp. CIR48]|uniref:right-handed parallel beta-helix repeat-containing protein n=1 Tax=Bradyrhizobium sp. CIR48 TaxID=2663840 RepID=UPI001AEE2CBF|nr:right-handed parallel beta-helix repeat-containing protein [Bradyrhizobium sp. CIR48]